MSTKSEVTVYGAGMSGLIAAMNLARDGYSVTVHESEPGFGGSQLYNPSTHVTPLDPEMTSDYIGIDITGAFHPLIACPSYFHETKVMLPVKGVYAVERGDRPAGLDALLYEECKKLGVSFEFSSPLKKEDLPNLPPKTIIACGLTPSVYDMLDIPYLKWYGWISRGEIGMSNYAWLWWDECITEYGYFSSVNNYYFNLLFSIREVGRNCLEKYKSFMVHNEGIEHDNWNYVSGAVPVASLENPRLFRDGAIMSGTISGAMDPMLWFGISGALVTGKVAALAVTDPDRARDDFDRFNKRFRKSFLMKSKVWYKFIRPNVTLIERAVNTVGAGTIERLGHLTETGKIPVKMSVPGFSHMSSY